MEDHSGVADRTVLSVDSAVARVKGKHHDGDVLSWTAFAVKSGGTANLFVLCGWKGFSFYKNKSGKTAPSYLHTKEKTKMHQGI